ncbi:YaeQ family protein [Rheinheimera sp.]|uniref:YaeQ family protein n=1 Tax=Rheinheimera sp. TaxID=1869214 RepID=UPI003AF7935C
MRQLLNCAGKAGTLAAIFDSRAVFMALKATIHKAQLQVSDLSRHHYQEYQLTLARHPSETEERLMLRVLAFALCADEQLQFGKGISDDDEAALAVTGLDGQCQLWIELGLPEERRLRKASHKANQVLLLAYGGTAVSKWYQSEQKALQALDNLSIFAISPEHLALLQSFCDRTMQLQCTINEGQIWFGTSVRTEQLALSRVKAARNELFIWEAEC